MRSRGLALILVVAVLGILAVLGSAFAILSRLERKSARQRVYATQALLLARSGIEDAFARLDAEQDAFATESLYGGEDWNNSGSLDLSIETANETYHAPLKLDVESCPVAAALRPTFFKRDNVGKPLTTRVDVRQRGYSGKLSSGNYALKVLPGGGFHVNGGDPAAAPTAGYNAVLRRVLGTLAEALDRGDGANDGSPVNQTDGEKLIDLRPRTAKGWGSYDQIRDLALGGSQAKLDLLKPYLALRAWVDKKVIAPTPKATLDLITGSWGNSWPDIIRLKPFNRPAPDFERIGARIVGRAPVDFSWARRRRPALIALLGDLTALQVSRDGFSDSAKYKSLRLFLDPTANDWSPASPSADDCRGVADAILASTSEVRTWSQWNALCDSLTIPGWAAADQAIQTARSAWEAQLSPWSGSTGDYGNAASSLSISLYSNPALPRRDLLKVHFNPNSDLNLFGPDRSMQRLVNKSDFSVYSTEFSLKSPGGERISAVGRVLDRGGRLLASRTLSAERPLRSLVRLTTQREFVAENLGRADEAGDESSYRAYGAMPYITPSYIAGTTFGSAWNGSGFTLQTYPEPHVVWTAPATGAPASYDGQIKLATVETVDDPSMSFLARWTDGYNATRSNGSPTMVPDTLHPPAANPVWHPTAPGMLRPDGLLVETGCEPGFAAAGAFHSHRGALSFWIKPDYEDLLSWSNRGLVNNTRYNGATDTGCFSVTATCLWEFASAFARPVAFGIHWEGQWDAAAELASPRPEVVRATARSSALTVQSGHRWRLLTAVWDLEQPDSTQILVDRGQASQESASAGEDVYMGVNSTTPTVDFTADDLMPTSVSALFHLGGKGQPGGGGGNPCQTFDEFAVYDPGPVTNPFSQAAALATLRYPEGRYYKESYYNPASADPLAQHPALPTFWRSAGEWFSAPIDMGRGARILGLSWTQIVPPELKPKGRIGFDFSNPGGTAYAKDASGVSLGKLRTRDDWSPVNRKVNAPFRLHAVFQPMNGVPSAVKDNTPILDALTLDDVTVAYRPAGGSPCGAWTEGE